MPFVCTFIFDKQSKFVGREQHAIEVDESPFLGMRNYNRVRLLNGDKSTKNDVGNEMSKLKDWDSAAKRGI